jgi:hypothetical protein
MVRILVTLSIVFWATLALSNIAEAQTVKGIAIVQAPEQGGGVCLAETPEKGFACAIKKCAVNGIRAQDCIKIQWCHNAGWTVDVFLQHNEGVHWHEASCGWATKTAAEKAAALMCDQKERQYVVGCILIQIYDPNGNPQINN